MLPQPSRLASLLVMAAALAACAMASASDPPQADPLGEADALAGPKVVDQAAKPDQPSLMQATFDGSTEDLRERPEVAALRLLTLAPQERDAVDKLLVARAARVDQMLRDNLDEFLELQGLLQAAKDQPAGYSRELLGKIMAMRNRARELVEPSLLDQVAALLSADNAGKLRRAVREYILENHTERAVNARTPARAAGSPPAESGPSRSRTSMPHNTMTDQATESDEPMPGSVAEQTATSLHRTNTQQAAGINPMQQRRYETGQLLREIGRAYAAIVQDRKDLLDRLIEVAQPTPEQEAKIQLIVRDMGVQGSLKPTSQQRAATFRKLMDILTPEQRERVREATK